MSKIDEYDRIVLEFAKQRLGYELDREKGTRDRASKLIEINLIIIGGLTAILTSPIGIKLQFDIFQKIAMFYGFYFLSASTVFSLIALLPRKKTIFAIERFHSKHEDKEFLDKINVMRDTILGIIPKNTKSVDQMVLLLLSAYSLLTIGIIALAITSVSLVLGINA